MGTQHLMVTKSCTCDTCKAMCKRAPCLGTPTDITRIMDAGHESKLAFTRWKDKKNPHVPLFCIAPIKGPNGCVFHNAAGLCDLHESGLKPTEGKGAMHDQPNDFLTRTVGYTWISEEGIKVFERFGVPHINELKEGIRELMPHIKPGKIQVIAKIP